MIIKTVDGRSVEVQKEHIVSVERNTTMNLNEVAGNIQGEYTVTLVNGTLSVTEDEAARVSRERLNESVVNNGILLG